MMLTKLLCRSHLHHAWRNRSTEDGQLYRQCVRCGKDDDRVDLNPGAWAPYTGLG